MLSIDIGIYHTVCCLKKEEEKYNIYLFQFKETIFEERLREIIESLNNIKEEVKEVIIEQQMPNTINIQIQYAIGMFFQQKGIKVKLQKASQKYKMFKGDKINNKIKSVMFIQDKLEQINIVYNAWSKKVYKNHLFLNQNARDFLQKNSIEKLDDIGDVVLMQLV